MSGVDKAYQKYAKDSSTPMGERGYGMDLVEEVEVPVVETKKEQPLLGAALLQQAAEAIMEGRNDTHGAKGKCFGAMADFLNFYLTNMIKTRRTIVVKDWDCALIMDGRKTCRILAGDPTHDDHWRDKAGYTGVGWDLISSKE